MKRFTSLKIKKASLLTCAVIITPLMLTACTGSAPTGYKFHHGNADEHALRSQRPPEILAGYLFGYEAINRADYRQQDMETVFYDKDPTFEELEKRSPVQQYEYVPPPAAPSADQRALVPNRLSSVSYAPAVTSAPGSMISRPAMNINSMALTRAASDIVSRFTREYGYPSRPVYLEPANDVAARYPGLDSAVMAAMQQNRWVLSVDRAENPIVFRYDATKLGQDGKSILTLQVPEAQPLLEYNGVYEVHAAYPNAVRPMSPPDVTQAPDAASTQPMSLLNP